MTKMLEKERELRDKEKELDARIASYAEKGGRKSKINTEEEADRAELEKVRAEKLEAEKKLQAALDREAAKDAERARQEAVAAANSHTAEAANAQRRTDVESVAMAFAQQCASTLPAEQPRSLCHTGANGLKCYVGDVDLTQDMFIVLSAVASTGVDVDTHLVSELRALHVPFDAQAHRTRLNALRLQSRYTIVELEAMRVDELIAAERASRVRVRGRKAPTGRPDIGSKAARQATARHRARKQH